jgi:uncharacterized membrane protein
VEDRVRVVGQPVRPLLLVIPLELFVTAVLFDLAGLATGLELFAEVAFWTLAVGLVTAVIAGLGALVDLRATRRGGDARRIAMVRGAASSAGAVLLTLVFFARLGGDHSLGVGLFVLELFALLVGVAGAVLGGWLARRERVVTATRERAESMARRLTGQRAPAPRSRIA